MTLDLPDREDRQWKNSLLTMEETQQALSEIDGADIKVDNPQEGVHTGKPVTIRISGNDFLLLERLAREVQDTIRDVVRLSPEARASLDDLADLTVPDEDGMPIPIRTVASIEPGVGPASIRRVDLKRVVTVDSDVVRASGRTENSVRQEVGDRLQTMNWPVGYRWEFAGSDEKEQESRAFLQKAFVIAVLLIMLVLVTQFDSLALPLTIMVSVVLSLIGVLWGLIVTATPFGIIMTGIGVISLLAWW